tara:strand:- start:10171 stop:10677 length:507 start_codon:yes stop_codon:yes gene_type:complete
MENKDIDKITFSEKIENFLKGNKKKIITGLIILIIGALCYLGLIYLDNKKNKDISEKYIKAGIYLTSKDLDNSKKIYEEIILSKNKFYSPLALNNIIENDLEKDNNQVLKLFEVVEDINMENEFKDLVILKKALYLIKINRVDEGKKLLEKIISRKSTWSEIALEILK